jgi:hypothetical protein
VAALAIDVAGFTRDDGTELDVRHDWHGYVGAPTCPSSVDSPADPQADPITEKERAHARTAALRGILCATVDEKLFHQVLTPNHDARHKDHFHLEVMRGTSWTMVQ